MLFFPNRFGVRKCAILLCISSHFEENVFVTLTTMYWWPSLIMYSEIRFREPFYSNKGMNQGIITILFYFTELKDNDFEWDIFSVIAYNLYSFRNA